MKMNLNKEEIDSYIDKLKDKDLSNVIFCPTSIYIPYFINNNLNVGIQDISRYEAGSHTGQISAKQVSSLNIKYSIVGHSETKNDLEKVHEKVVLCDKYDITPIICIGEKEQIDIESTKKIIKEQLDAILKDTVFNKIIIAYEPVWMIGSNNSIDISSLHLLVTYIKEYIKKYQINDIMVLYGGSVNKINARDIMDNTDGILIGSASLDINQLLEIIEVA